MVEIMFWILVLSDILYCATGLYIINKYYKNPDNIEWFIKIMNKK